MNAAGWLRLVSCGCAGPRHNSCISEVETADTSAPSTRWPPPFDQWSFRAPSTAPASASHRSRPSDTSTVDSSTPLRTALPASTPASETSRWSPDSDGEDTFARQVRRSTSKVVMYLRHRASTMLQPPVYR